MPSRCRAKAQAPDARLERVVALMDDLFAIDRQAREQKLSLDDRHALRQERAPALLDELHALLSDDASLGRHPAAVGCRQGHQLHAEALGGADTASSTIPSSSYRRTGPKTR